MHNAPKMPTATCAACGQKFAGFTTRAASDALWSHDEVDHRGGGLADIHQLTTVDWHRQALQAVLAFARTGKPFVISAALLSHGVPDAPQAGDYRRIQAEAEANGWIEQTGRMGRSVRPTTKGSPCAEWIGTPRIRRVA